MGVEGIAVAAAVILLVVIVMPAIYRQRAVVAEAPKDERYAPDLRMIHERTYTQTNNSTYRCTIFPTERVMDMKQKPAANPRQRKTSQLRSLARARSRAKARIAARHAARVRYGVGAVAIAAITVIVWILVFSVSLPLAAAIVLSLILGLYVAGYAYMLNFWGQADRDDTEKLAATQARIDELRRGKRTEASSAADQERRQGREVGAERQGRAERERNRGEENHEAAIRRHKQRAGEETMSTGVRVIRADRGQLTALEAEKTPQQRRAQGQLAESSRVQARRVSTQRDQRDQRVAARTERGAGLPSRENTSTTPATPAPAKMAKITLPSYTLKPRYDVQRKADARSIAYDATAAHAGATQTKRALHGSVAEQIATDQVQAAVPYRPQGIGERVGDVLPEEPNAVPDVIADEPARHQRVNVLGVGETLDSLLDRRRA